jgi:2-C-methyl-D-erythritol 2,4-cyclodiphosphate synthase
MRVGLGHDTHRLAAGKKLLLGGVEIEHSTGGVGHSDADVLLHAVTDALLGALGLGDIGEWFSNSDPRWANADSVQFVKAALAEVGKSGWEIANLDTTIFAEKPHLKSHKPRIRERLAEVLEIAVDRISVKAKSGEQVGPIGREEAIAADAIVLLRRRPN